ncbi:TRAP transporter large permease [Pseudogemmobacter sonorensis]|uniref:TRAP transporter large permease n=1 Tax=Pseudogemmobacter sonorensis TaxID=2989681 RepID=UPI00367A908B
MIAGLSFFGLMALGLPLAFAMIAAAWVLIHEGGNPLLMQGFAQQLFAGIETPAMLTLPLFILLGEVMGASGIGRRLLRLAEALLPPLRAGLAQVNLLCNLMMASVLGSTVAQLTVMSRLAVPEMERAGYPRETAATVTAAGALLAPVLPPSMNLIVFAAVAQLPVADLFRAAILPGLAIALAFVLVIAWTGRRENLPHSGRLSRRERLGAIRQGLPGLLVPVTAIGTIMTGIATPTEAAAFATLAALGIGGLNGDLRPRALPGVLSRTAVTSGVVLYLVAAAQVVAWVLTFSNVPQLAANWIENVAGSPLMFLLLLNLLLLVLGTVLEPIPAIILTAPVLLPVATGVFGIDPLAFGVILCANLALGLLTPPVGAGLYTAALMTGVSPGRLSWRLAPYFIAVLAVIAGLSVLTALAAS